MEFLHSHTLSRSLPLLLNLIALFLSYLPSAFFSPQGSKGGEDFATDEYPRPETTLAAMAKLPTVFKKNGTVTAATASGISDGAI